MDTDTLKPPAADVARRADSPESGGHTSLTGSEREAPPRISLRFDSAAGPLTGVLIDERSGEASWFMGWHELIREIQATRPQAQDDPSLRAATTTIAFGLVRDGRPSISDQARDL
jgi:hypothetical protein